MQVLNFPSPYRQGEAPYDIFKNRNKAILSIVGGIKGIIENKFINNQLKLIAGNIFNKMDEQKSAATVNLINEKPPDSIYPKELENTIGQFYDKFAMGPPGTPETGSMTPNSLLANKLPAIYGTAPTTTPSEETMIPKNDMYQLYNVIKDLPTDDINWENIYKKMTEKKPFWMGATESEQFVLNQMMGQVKDPRSKIASDINLANIVKEAFYPEEEKPTEWEKKTELFLQTNPTVDEVKEFVGGRIAPEKMSDFDKKWNLLMQRDHTAEEEKRLMGAYIETGTKTSIEDILTNIPEGFEISSFNRSTTGATSFSFKPVGTTTVWEFDTWDKAKAFADTHPQEGFIPKIETNKQGFDVNWYKTGTEGTLKPITGADIKTFGTMIYGDEKNPGIVTPEDYEKTKDYITRTEKNFPIPPYLEITEKNLEACLDAENKVTNIDLYKYLYEFYKNELKGGVPKYLPPEAIPVKKTGFFKNNTEYGSALADDYELDFEAMKKDNVSEEEIMKKLEEIGER